MFSWEEHLEDIIRKESKLMMWEVPGCGLQCYLRERLPARQVISFMSEGDTS